MSLTQDFNIFVIVMSKISGCRLEPYKVTLLQLIELFGATKEKSRLDNTLLLNIIPVNIFCSTSKFNKNG